ncbi:MAG: division/cell wall cluster transcriptional repressor MraZ [Christensenellales bacterium]|jgi:MraZ protein
MLIGEYRHALDAKGRLIVPSKFREDLGEKFILTRGIGSCLFGLSLEEWDNFSAKLRGLPMTDAYALDFVRLFFAGATECELDKQGRILIPAHLREAAALSKDAVVTGVMSRIEIWDSGQWDDYQKKADASFNETLLKMAQLGI